MSSAVPLHVTLRFPLTIKMNGEPRFVRCFDATHEKAASSTDIYDGDNTIRVFRAVKIWAVAMKGGEHQLVSYKTGMNLLIPADNIAGVVSQPFDK